LHAQHLQLVVDAVAGRAARLALLRGGEPLRARPLVEAEFGGQRIEVRGRLSGVTPRVAGALGRLVSSA
jgi:hypothetical protein